MFKIVWMFLFSYSVSSVGFIPAVESSLEQIAKGRSAHGWVEGIFLHRVASSTNQLFQIEEQVLISHGNMEFSWTLKDTGERAYGIWNGKEYKLTNGQKVPSRSQVYLSYFFKHQPEEIRDVLLREQFIRRDQLKLFKADYAPTGDPGTWETKKFLIVHPDISLTRLAQGISERIEGLKTSGNRKIVYLSREQWWDRQFSNGKRRKVPGRGIYRLEWGIGDRSFSWNFDKMQWMKVGGFFPREVFFEDRGVEIIRGEVLSLDALTKTEYLKAKKNWNPKANMAISPNFSVALETLLNYR